MYSIVDIETTGNGYTGMKITEISIFKHDGKKVVDEFTSLVDPECNIPPFITNLTGITNAMVSNAPKFYEIAKQVHSILEGTIFIAHSVNFDYNIIKREFKDLGFDFKKKKLCTVRLSRKLIPGLSSYSLGALCASQNITIKDRHRARGDAEATVILFEQLLERDQDKTVINSFLNQRSRQGTLPPLLATKIFDNLPKTPGVYYFKNLKKDIIYVGKAINIRQRVLSHFYDKAKKELTMCMETADISYTETGSELIALLLESAEIKKWFPKYNRAQKHARESIALFTYQDQSGVMHLAYNTIKMVPKPLIKFYNVSQCRAFLEQLCETYELCPKYCHLQTNVTSCFHYQIKKCKGICRAQEDVNSYNQRVTTAIASFMFNSANFLIRETGKSTNETAWVWVQNDAYKGFGYTTKPETPSHTELTKFITSQKDNKHIHNILNAYLKKHPENCIPIADENTLIIDTPQAENNDKWTLFG